MVGRSFIWGTLPLVCGMAAGCLPPLPENGKAIEPPRRQILMETPDSRMAAEDGVENGVWLEVFMGDGRSVGGYLSQNESPRRALVILLHGASTFAVQGSLGSTRDTHLKSAPMYWEEGFLTWSLMVRECGSPYGQGDLEDLITAIDWLDAVGRDTLDVDKVYVLGYSVGGTQALLLNRFRHVDGIIEVSGLVTPENIQRDYLLFYLAGAVYPLNLGVCQMFDTVQYYGLPGSPAWVYLDTVAHIEALRNPMLAIHGVEDRLFAATAAQALQARYEELLAEGVPLQPIEFVFLPGVGHFPDFSSGPVKEAILGFLDRY
jgi:pimeloyl-ACP methyl ester carboxylesterase